MCRFAYTNLFHLFVYFQQTLSKCSATFFFFFFCTNADSGFWKIIFQSSFWSWFCFNEVITSSGTEEITKRKSTNICCFYTRSVFFPLYPPTREKINASDVCDWVSAWVYPHLCAYMCLPLVYTSISVCMFVGLCLFAFFMPLWTLSIPTTHRLSFLSVCS